MQHADQSSTENILIQPQTDLYIYMMHVLYVILQRLQVHAGDWRHESTSLFVLAAPPLRTGTSFDPKPFVVSPLIAPLRCAPPPVRAPPPCLA